MKKYTLILNVGCKSHEQGSIPSKCQIPQITGDVAIGPVNLTIASVASVTSIYKITPIIHNQLMRINKILPSSFLHCPPKAK